MITQIHRPREYPGRLRFSTGRLTLSAKAESQTLSRKSLMAAYRIRHKVIKAIRYAYPNPFMAKANGIFTHQEKYCCGRQ